MLILDFVFLGMSTLLYFLQLSPHNMLLSGLHKLYMVLEKLSMTGVEFWLISIKLPASALFAQCDMITLM